MNKKSYVSDKFDSMREQENLEKEEESAEAVQQTISHIIGNPYETPEEKTNKTKKEAEKPEIKKEKEKEKKPENTTNVEDLFSDMKISEGGVAGSYYLDKEVVAKIEEIAKKYKISKSKALNKILRNALKL